MTKTLTWTCTVAEGYIEERQDFHRSVCGRQGGLWDSGGESFCETTIVVERRC